MSSTCSVNHPIQRNRPAFLFSSTSQEMEYSNWRIAKDQVVVGEASDVAKAAITTMDTFDWRTGLHLDSRQRIVNKILDTLKRHLPFSGQEGLQELKKICIRFEEKIYTDATSQSNYLRKISLKSLCLEARSQNPMANSLQTIAVNTSTIPSVQTSIGQMSPPYHAESTIWMIVSEPLNVVSQRFSEMSGQQAAALKESARDAILNSNRQWQLSSFQRALHSRSDITFEMLVESHPAQLEILLAMKTGLKYFLQCNNSNISSSDLAEIFMNKRCRNIRCWKLLPVDECNCKLCAQKNGFCRDCMCPLCSKFDMASGTCSWVPCELCLHKCHVDCAIQESYIRNGHSATSTEGTSEMQFHCVICGHPSEMFSFVKKVFQNFAKRWTAETVLRELNYVKRIFCPSKDFRGKILHEVAFQMLSNLENTVYVHEVENHIMGFLGVLDRIMEDDKQVNLFLEKCDKEGQTSKKRRIIEPKEEVRKLSSPSETDTTLLLGRARKLLRGNEESRKIQCMELEETMNAINKDKSANDRTSFSSSSSCSFYSTPTEMPFSQKI